MLTPVVGHVAHQRLRPHIDPIVRAVVDLEEAEVVPCAGVVNIMMPE